MWRGYVKLCQKIQKKVEGTGKTQKNVGGKRVRNSNMLVVMGNEGGGERGNIYIYIYILVIVNFN